MSSVLSELYYLGEKLFNSNDTILEILFYEIELGDFSFSLMSLVLPSFMVVFISYQFVKWCLDIL